MSSLMICPGWTGGNLFLRSIRFLLAVIFKINKFQCEWISLHSQSDVRSRYQCLSFGLQFEAELFNHANGESELGHGLPGVRKEDL
jgi:hypothetical protein